MINHEAEIPSSTQNDSVDIKKGSDVSASFGAITTIGPTGGSHVLISGEQIAIKRA